MNDIKELLEIISSLGGSASIDEIAATYARQYKMPISLVPKGALTSTLSNCKGDLCFNQLSLKWELRPKIGSNSVTGVKTTTDDNNSLFWHGFTEYAFGPQSILNISFRPDHKNKEQKNWYDLFWDGPISPEPVHLVLRITNSTLAAEIYIRKSAHNIIDALNANKELCQSICNTNLLFEDTHHSNSFTAEAQAYKVVARCPTNGKKEDQSSWPHHYLWFVEMANNLKKVCDTLFQEELSQKTLRADSSYNRYQVKREKTEKLLIKLCSGHNEIEIDTSKVKNTPVLINGVRVMSIYYRSNAIRIDVVIDSPQYAIIKELEAKHIAYQKSSANPYATSGVYAAFIDEANEETAYKYLLGIS